MPKVLSITEAEAFASRLRQSTRTVVFTNGVFDLLHPGHVRYLQDARRQGDALVVGVNSDRSVRAIKGPERRHAEQERAKVLRRLVRRRGRGIRRSHPQKISSRCSPTCSSKAPIGRRRDFAAANRRSAGGRVVRIASRKAIRRLR